MERQAPTQMIPKECQKLFFKTEMVLAKIAWGLEEKVLKWQNMRQHVYESACNLLPMSVSCKCMYNVCTKYI